MMNAFLEFNKLKNGLLNDKLELKFKILFKIVLFSPDSLRIHIIANFKGTFICSIIKYLIMYLFMSLGTNKS
jgi:hypothetical protein